MYIIIETIPQNGDDYINIEISKGNCMYHNCLETECNIYVKENWNDVTSWFLEKFHISFPYNFECENVQIDFWVISKEFTAHHW